MLAERLNDCERLFDKDGVRDSDDDRSALLDLLVLDDDETDDDADVLRSNGGAQSTVEYVPMVESRQFAVHKFEPSTNTLYVLLANADSVGSHKVPLHEVAVLVIKPSRFTKVVLSYAVRVEPSTTSHPTAKLDVESRTNELSLVLYAAAT